MNFYILLIAYVSLVESVARQDWPDYNYVPELKGWVKIHRDGVNWDAADAKCRQESALLITPWSPKHIIYINQLQTDPALATIYSGSRVKYPQGMYTRFRNTTILTLHTSAVESCIVFKHGSTDAVSCEEIFPYVCFAPEPVSRQDWPGYNYVSGLKGSVKIYESVTWRKAKQICEDENALMLSPWTPEFKTAINDLQRARSMPVVFTGGHVTTDGGKYRYINGEPVVSSSGRDQLERCVVLFANGTTGEVDCEDKQPFVCYAAEGATTAPTNLTICASPQQLMSAGFDALFGYEYKSATGRCYKFHARAELWETARSICRLEGADLVVINSEAEAQLLSDTYKRFRYTNVDCHGEKNCHRDYAAIGVYYSRSSHQYLTIQDKTLDQAGYDEWEHKMSPYHTHGCMLRNGKLQHYPGMRYHIPFICEKEPWNIEV